MTLSEQPSDLQWKRLRVETRKNLVPFAKGSVLTQTDLINKLELPEFAVFEVPIGEIDRRTGLVFRASSGPEAATDRKRAPKAEALEKPKIRRIGSVREILP